MKISQIHEFSLNRVTKKEFFLLDNKFPEKFRSLFKSAISKFSEKLGQTIVNLHDNETINLNECFANFRLKEAFVRDRDTIQMNFVSKEDNLKIIQATAHFGGKNYSTFMVLVLITGKLFSENQLMIDGEPCFVYDTRKDSNPILDNLRKDMKKISNFLRELSVLSKYL